MTRLHEVFDGIEDEDVQSDLREISGALLRGLRRFGQAANEEQLMPLLEEFCLSVGEIEQRHPFLDPDTSDEIREWYAEYAIEHELAIASLDDLDEPPSW